jgi:two-component system, NtrC family, sensor kinase
MFSYFMFFYFPLQQEKSIIKNYANEVQNLANVVKAGVRRAIDDGNYMGLKNELQIIKDDPRFSFVSIVEEHTVWSADYKQSTLYDSVVTIYPQGAVVPLNITANDTVIVTRAPLNTRLINGYGAILVGFKTYEIYESNRRITMVSLAISGLVFILAILTGYWLSRNISKPVLALVEAARKVGKGDFSQKVHIKSHDEIGELSNAFNNMVEELAGNEVLKKANLSLASLNKTLNITIEHLKATQAQLIQSEKMASLGELTAGIAHEIQNPLNFVNNFSEVTEELLNELEGDAIQKLPYGDKEKAVDMIRDAIQNIQKVNHHGKRADAIVKGMLQHSRKSTGQQEPTDINALANEFLRLSYQGFRAKEKLFNATLNTDFDKQLEKINVVPQDIGRVLLNLYNNSFYTVSEKKKANGQDYEAIVTVSTRKKDDKLEVRVIDNGMGIPKHLIDKIFQPFFTTKPAGQGTGLGLSLSHDFIVSHGGTLFVETQEGEGTSFIFQLPLDKPEV